MAHYPSWGSETCSENSAVKLGNGRLITPHGDRKLPKFGVTSGSHPYSLPLMGIGNNSVSAHTSASRPHYPSWGSETTNRRLTPDELKSYDSLPLMGIGNSGPWLIIQLITAHYPSWGSETAMIRCCAVSFSSSLPLMGIGNLPGLNLTAEVLISLPLMGIGNHGKIDHEEARHRLITPHGDRKPFTLR